MSLFFAILVARAWAGNLPERVKITTPFEANIVVNGKPVGKMTVAAGRLLPLKVCDTETATVEVGPGNDVKIPISYTDVETKSARVASTPAPAAEPSATPEAAPKQAPPAQPLTSETPSAAPAVFSGLMRWPQTVKTIKPITISFDVGSSKPITRDLKTPREVCLKKVEGDVATISCNQWVVKVPLDATDAALLPYVEPEPTPVPLPNKVGLSIDGKLVVPKNGRAKKYDGPAFASKDYVAVFFANKTCGACGAYLKKVLATFSTEPELARRAGLVLYSTDTSEKEMLAMMEEKSVPFPAIDFDKVNSTLIAPEKIMSPMLLIFDRDGKMVVGEYGYPWGDSVGDRFQKLADDLQKELGEREKTARSTVSK